MLHLATNPSGADPYDQAKHLTLSPPAYFLNGMLNHWAGAVCANEYEHNWTHRRCAQFVYSTPARPDAVNTNIRILKANEKHSRV